MRGQWQISRFEVISLRPARTQLWSCITEYIWWSWDEPLWSRGFLAANRQMYCKPVTLPWSGPNHQIKVALSPYIIILELRTATMMFHLPPPDYSRDPCFSVLFHQRDSSLNLLFIFSIQPKKLRKRHFHGTRKNAFILSKSGRFFSQDTK
jgi:hypothetical protein